MERESKHLTNICGAWVDNDQVRYVTTAVKAQYDLSKVTPRVRSAVIQGLRDRVLGTTSGHAAAIFRTISNEFDLKFICASTNGDAIYMTYRDHVVEESLLAANALAMQRNTYNRFRSYQWYGYPVRYNGTWKLKPGIVKQVLDEHAPMCNQEKERREEAIDFLSAGGKFTQTFIDRKPR